MFSQQTLPFPTLSTVSDVLQEELSECNKNLWHLWPGSEAAGHFLAMPRRVSEELVARDAAVFLDDQKKFQTAKLCLLCSDGEFARLKGELRAALRRLCVTGRRRTVVQVPAAFGGILEEVKGITWLQPQSLANMLKGFDTKHATIEEADALVEYLLSPQGAGPLALLHGLRLCPLLSGQKGTFLHRVEGEPYYWSEDPEMQQLLPDREFVDPASRTFALLKPRVANSHLNISLLNCKALTALLPSILPPSWKNKGQVVINKAAGQIEVDGKTQEAVRQEYLLAHQAAHKAAAPKRSSAKKLQSRTLPKGAKKGQRGLKDHAWHEDYDDEDWEEDEGEEEFEEPVGRAIPDTKPRNCPILDVAGLEAVVRRCRLMWRLVEKSQEKGNSMEGLQLFPCVPVEEAEPHHVGCNGCLRLISLPSADNKQLAAIEDFSVEEVGDGG